MCTWRSDNHIDILHILRYSVTADWCFVDDSRASCQLFHLFSKFAVHPISFFIAAYILGCLGPDFYDLLGECMACGSEAPRPKELVIGAAIVDTPFFMHTHDRIWLWDILPHYPATKDTIDNLLFVDKLIRCQRGPIHLSLAEKSGQVLTLKASTPLTDELIVLYLIGPMIVKGTKTFPTSVGYGKIQHLVQVLKKETGMDFNGSVVYVDGFNQYLFSLKQRSDKPYKRRFRKNIPKF